MNREAETLPLTMTQPGTKLIGGVLLGCTVMLGAVMWVRRSNSNARVPLMPVTHPAGAPANEPAASGETAVESLRADPVKSFPRFEEEAAKLRLLPMDGGQRAKALADLVGRWMPRDPRGCLAFLETLPADALRVSLNHQAMKLWLAADRVTARSFAELRIFADDRSSKFYLEPVLEDILQRESGVEQVFRYLGKLPQTEELYGAAVPVLCGCLRRDLGGSIALAGQIPARVKTGFLEMAGAVAAMQKGTSLLHELAGPGRRTDLSPEQVNGILSSLLGSAPAETLRWLEAQPASPVWDRARFHAVQTLGVDQPEAALKLAAMMTDPNLRKETARMFLPNWAAKDYSAAEAWAIASDLPTEMVAPILLSAQARPVPFEQRMAKILWTGDTKTLRRSQAVIYAQWVSADSNAAANWLKQSDLSLEEKKSWATILP